MRLPNAPVHVALAALTSGGPDREVGLSLTPITVTEDGLEGITEPTAASYARADLPATAWADPADRAVQTTSPVYFPDAAPDEDDWGVVVEYFLTDGAGVPEIPLLVADGGEFVAAGAAGIHVRPRLTPNHFKP